MEKTLRELAEFVGGEVHGDAGITIQRVSPIEQAADGDITFVSNPRYLKLLEETGASAVIVSDDAPKGSKAQIRIANPYLAFARVQELLHGNGARRALGIASTHIGSGVEVGDEPSIYPTATVGEGTVIGDRVTLYSGAYVGPGCRLGDDVTLFPNTVVYGGTRIGDRVRIHAGTVVGSDGFGYATHKGGHHKILHAGTVVIEDDVEIGSNCSIDRAVTAGKATVIGRGTKIDNLVQIAHNVELGEECLIVAQVGISGSSKVGRRVTLGGQVGLTGHISVGDGASAGAQTGITKSVEAGAEVLGSPAAPVMRTRRQWMAITRLPELLRRVRKVEGRLDSLENGRTDEGGAR